MAVMDVLEEEELLSKALKNGLQFKNGLDELMSSHEIIGDVRGKGLFLGIELVKNRETLDPAIQEASELVDNMRELGVLLSTDGPMHNVIKIKPPMVINQQDIDDTLSKIDLSL